MNQIDAATAWRTLTERCGVAAQGASAHFEQVARAYAEPHRAYHNLNHIAHVLTELERAEVYDPAAYWAAWYHDVVYRPGRGDNEAKSAEIARQALADMGVDSAIRDQTEALILATRDHDAESDNESEALFLDADMAILGAPGEVYQAYADAVRKEHSHIPSLLFNRGRRRFLRDTLGKPSIFHTDTFRARYEAQARSNMARELAGIRGLG